MKTVSLAEHKAILKAQGVPVEHLAYRCPMCKTVQSSYDFMKATGKTREEITQYQAYSCIGRFTDAGPYKKGTPPGSGCNWTLGGLFQIHKYEVQLPDGTSAPCFELVTAEEAQAHMNRNLQCET